jgi:two-component system, OmpR family, copper resistance phosphate regulon response regulator CusR
MRILVLEDEVKVARALAEGLQAESHEVSVCHSGEEGFFAFCSRPFDLLILDLMLPGRNGLEILEAIRAQGSRMPVLVLTAKDAVEDRVRGLDCGADDYLVKPFAFSELLARIRALSRRDKVEPAASLTCGDLELDRVTRKCRRSGRDLMLTAKEYELLCFLMLHRNQAVSRDMLAREVWQVSERATPLDNVIDVHIARLRRKIDEPFECKMLKTIRGVGFILEE